MRNRLFRKLDDILDNNRSFGIFTAIMVLSTFWIGAWGLLVFPVIGVIVGLYISWSYKQEAPEPIGSIQSERGEGNGETGQVQMPKVRYRHHA